MLRVMLFSLLYFGFIPRIASEKFDSGEPRIQKLYDLIRESKYGIHDLSRIKAQKKGDLYRLNMPFELGLDIGCREFGEKTDKHHLILETKRYRYQAALSDLANSDIMAHNDDESTLVKCIRRWFASNGFRKLQSPTIVWYDFQNFMADFYNDRKSAGFSDDDIYDLPIPEYVDDIRDWLKK